MLVQSRLKVKAVFLVAALSLTACGQNASIAKKSGVASTSAIDKANSPQSDLTEPSAAPTSAAAPTPSKPTNPPSAKVIPVVSTAPQPGAPAAPPGTPSAPANPTSPYPSNPAKPGTPVATSPSIPPATSPATPPSVTTPAPAKPVAPVAPGAGNGPAPGNGPSSPVTPSSHGGHGIPETQNFSAVPMVEGADYTIAELPYKSSKAHKIAVIQLGQATPGKILNGQPYVQDSQVLFKMPMHLPPKEAITKVYDAYVQLSLSKYSNLGHPKTEWICFLDQRVCSGQVYDEPGWQGNINPQFWGHLNNEIKNADFFSTAFIQGAGNKVGTTPQGWDLWLNESFTLKLEDILKGSNYKDVLSFLYDGVAANSPLDKALRVVVADDTRVSNAKLVFSYEEDTSKAFELQSQQPAQQKPATASGPVLKTAVLKNVAKQVK